MQVQSVSKPKKAPSRVAAPKSPKLKTAKQEPETADSEPKTAKPKLGLHDNPMRAVWRQMIQRCTNPKNKRFKAYGARGVTVCQAWIDSFEQWEKDVGPRPPGEDDTGRALYSLDRKNNERGYEPGNVVWSTREQQDKNTQRAIAKRQKEAKISATVREAFLRGDVQDHPLDGVRPNDWNPNEVSSQQLASIRYGFQTVGWLRSHALTIWGSDEKGETKNIIIDGEHRWEVACKLGMKTGPMLFLHGITEHEAQELTIILDNLRGRFRDKPLATIMSKLLRGTDKTIATLKFGFSLKDFAKFDRRETKPEDRTFSEAKKPAKPKTRLGDLYKLGPHRLLCADAFVDGSLQKLLGAELGKIDLFLGDPPYAIYGSSTGMASDVADDSMVRPFFVKMFETAREALRNFAHIYACCDWRSWASIWEAAKQAQVSPKNCIVWDKGSGLGSQYAMTYELVGFFAKLPARKAMKASGAVTGQRSVFKNNLIRINRVSPKEREHNAAKPVELLQQLIENSTDEGDSVIDMFGGSGSTLIAAEETGRVCFMFDKDPGWCDVIVHRWEKITGKTATRERAK